jgi:hypothetical protein
MTNCSFTIFSVLVLATMPALGANPALTTVVGRTIYHADDTRTESIRDPLTRELTEMTYNSTGVMTVKKVFLLNEKGEPLQGNVYDGRGNLVARCQSVYDDFGRRKEDKLMNLNGEVFQHVIHEYGPDGKARTPKVVNLNVKSPIIKPGLLDLTKNSAGPQQPQTMDGSQGPTQGIGQGRFAPVPLPTEAGKEPPLYAPGTAPVTPPAEEKPKSSFFKRLFKKDK